MIRVGPGPGHELQGRGEGGVDLGGGDSATETVVVGTGEGLQGEVLQGAGVIIYGLPTVAEQDGPALAGEIHVPALAFDLDGAQIGGGPEVE